MASRASHVRAMLDSCYASHASHAPWAAEVADAIRPFADLGLGLSVSLMRVRHGRGHQFMAHAGVGPARSSGAYEALPSIIGHMDRKSFDACFYGPRVYMSVAHTARFNARENHSAALRHFGARDFLGAIGRPSGDAVCMVIAPRGRAANPGPRARQTLRHLLGHLELAARLRLAPSAPLAIFSAHGQLLHAQPALRSKALRRLRVSVEGLQGGDNRSNDAELSAATWGSLVSGRWRIAPHVDTDGKRLFHVHANESEERQDRALSSVERAVVEYALRGATGKETAIALGIGENDVSEALLRAALKFGFTSRAQLLTIGTALNGRSVSSLPLTPAEREVLDGIARGLRNRDIARERMTSKHTVANQVASILRKTSAPTRRALLATLGSHRFVCSQD